MNSKVANINGRNSVIKYVGGKGSFVILGDSSKTLFSQVVGSQVSRSKPGGAAEAGVTTEEPSPLLVTLRPGQVQSKSQCSSSNSQTRPPSGFSLYCT